MIERAVLSPDIIPQKYKGNETYLFGQVFSRGHPQELCRYAIRRLGDPLREVHDLSLTIMVKDVNTSFAEEVLELVKRDINNKGWTKPPYQTRQQVLDAVVKEIESKR